MSLVQHLKPGKELILRTAEGETRIELLEIEAHRVKIAISAPEGVLILRAELVNCLPDDSGCGIVVKCPDS